MPSGAKKRRNARKKKETALHESVPANIPAGVEALEREPKKCTSILLDEDDGVEDSSRSGDSERICSNSSVDNHHHHCSSDSIGETPEIGEVQTMDGREQKYEDIVGESNNDFLGGDEKLESGKNGSELVKPSKDDKTHSSSSNSSSSSSSSSSDDESDHEKVKESENPEIPSDSPGTDGNEVVEVVEIPIENYGLESLVEEVKEELAKGEGNFSSALASSVESVKEAIGEYIQKSEFAGSVESIKEDMTAGIQKSDFISSVESIREVISKSVQKYDLFSSVESIKEEVIESSTSTEVHRDVKQPTAILETAKISIGETSKDVEKSEETVKEISLPPPIAQQASWKSCCGLFDIFTGGRS